jgi:hypothetical protein
MRIFRHRRGCAGGGFAFRIAVPSRPFLGHPPLKRWVAFNGRTGPRVALGDAGERQGGSRRRFAVRQLGPVTPGRDGDFKGDTNLPQPHVGYGIPPGQPGHRLLPDSFEQRVPFKTHLLRCHRDLQRYGRRRRASGPSRDEDRKWNSNWPTLSDVANPSLQVDGQAGAVWRTKPEGSVRRVVAGEPPRQGRFSRARTITDRPRHWIGRQSPGGDNRIAFFQYASV